MKLLQLILVLVSQQLLNLDTLMLNTKQTIVNGNIKICCQDKNNRETLSINCVPDGKMYIEQCKVCQAKHYIFKPKTVELGANVYPLGGK